MGRIAKSAIRSTRTTLNAFFFHRMTSAVMVVGLTDASPANFKCILFVRRFAHCCDDGRRDCLVNDKPETGHPQTVTSPRVATRRSRWKQDRPPVHLSAVKITKPNAIPQTPGYVSHFPPFASRELAYSCSIFRSPASQVPSWVP